MNDRPPLPPFTEESAIQKVRLAEDAWNTRNAEHVSLGYTEDSRWRNRVEFATGREMIVALLKRKWARELDYRLVKELWGFAKTAWLSGSATNIMTILETGFAHTGTSSGTMTTTD